MRKWSWIFLLAACFVTLVVGCSGDSGTADSSRGTDTTDDGGKTTKYSISGNVTTGGSGLAGVTMTLSGASSATATTDAGGGYQFTDLSNGSYTVLPSKDGYSFNPETISVSVSGANVTGRDYSATSTSAALTYSISGDVTSGGVSLAGVTVTLSGASSATVINDAGGGYQFTGLSNGSYTITPSKEGYTFNPTNISVSVSGANATGNSFTASLTAAMAPWTLLKLPDTGQTTSYIDTFGEDADYTINPPSYSDNGNDTITDNVTGLIWQKQNDGIGRTWGDAISYCDGLTLGGQSDWRLPNDIELMSIVDYGRSWQVGTSSQVIDTSYFSTTESVSAYYWTASEFDANNALVVHFNYGYVWDESKTGAAGGR